MSIVSFTIEEVVGKTTPVFHWNYGSTKRVRVNSGGTGSSKTISILQVLIVYAITQQNKVITIAGQDFPNLRVGALRDFKTLLNNSLFAKAQVKEENKSSSTWTFKSGTIIEFNSYDDAQDAKSGKRDILFLNEANGVGLDIYTELADRTSDIIFLDFNPTAHFWAHDTLMGDHDVDWFISNFTHNPFIPKEIRRKLLGYKESNPARWRVYGMGLKGTTEGCIYQNWEKEPFFPDECDKWGYGLDFGFSVDPTALVKFGLFDGKYYVEEIVYGRGLKDNDLSDALKEQRVGYFDLVVADPSAPQSIATLNDIYGFSVEKAKKGPDSVSKGIQLLQELPLVVVGNSPNIVNELENYIWKKQKGQTLNIPVDKHNHALDAMRYIATYLLTTEGEEPYNEHYAQV